VQGVFHLPGEETTGEETTSFRNKIYGNYGNKIIVEISNSGDKITVLGGDSFRWEIDNISKCQTFPQLFEQALVQAYDKSKWSYSTYPFYYYEGPERFF